MPPPSQIAIATSVVNRLVKEETSYQREYESQKARIAKLEAGESDDGENAEYILRQERKVLSETSAMFPQLKQKITEAKEKLEAQLEQDKGPGDQSNTPEDVTKAKEAIAAALVAIRESS